MTLTQTLSEEWFMNFTTTVNSLHLFKSAIRLYRYQVKIDYKGSRTVMWRILKSLKLKYEKYADGRRFRMERNDIVTS